MVFASMLPYIPTLWPNSPCRCAFGRALCEAMVGIGLGNATLRVFGDSNAVGYRPGAEGTKRYLENHLKRYFHVVPTWGRTGLTVLPSKYQCLPWMYDKLGCSEQGCSSVDHSLLILGTNDITSLKSPQASHSLGCLGCLERKHHTP
jgi:lysophospholipase L1-like esterase